jgi:hypothetical protein
MINSLLHVFMYVMYLCLYVCIDAHMFQGHTYSTCIHVRIYIYIYIYIYIHIYSGDPIHMYIRTYVQSMVVCLL